MGGQFGLCLGASILTLGEFGEALMGLIRRCVGKKVDTRSTVNALNEKTSKKDIHLHSERF